MPKILYDSDASEDPEDNSNQTGETPIINDTAASSNVGQFQESPAKIVKNKVPVQPFECQFCKAKFVRNAFLQKHITELRCPVRKQEMKRLEDKLEKYKNNLVIPKSVLKETKTTVIQQHKKKANEEQQQHKLLLEQQKIELAKKKHELALLKAEEKKEILMRRKPRPKHKSEIPAPQPQPVPQPQPYRPPIKIIF